MAQPAPPELLGAIERASEKYHIPVDIEVGIWRVESGSSYPNPFRNSLGYGGLFGTTKWNASTQEQADYSESILANLLRTHHGSIADSLHAYSGGGYTSVPGETTFGTLKGFGGKGGGGLFPGVGRTLTHLPGGNILFGSGPGGVQGAIVPKDPLGGLFGGIESLVLRALLILAGALLVIAGLFLVAHSLGARVPAVVTTAAAALPAGRAAGAAAATTSAKIDAGAARERRAEEAHQARLAHTRARTEATAASIEAKRRTKAEQEKAEKRAYFTGATDAAREQQAAARAAKERRSGHPAAKAKRRRKAA